MNTQTSFDILNLDEFIQEVIFLGFKRTIVFEFGSSADFIERKRRNFDNGFWNVKSKY